MEPSLSRWNRARIEQNLGIKAYDIYGTSAMSDPLFTECSAPNGIHAYADHFVIEIVDDCGGPVEEGEKASSLSRRCQRRRCH